MFSSFPPKITKFLFKYPLEDIFILEFGYNDFNKIPANYQKRYQYNYCIHLILDGKGLLNYEGQQFNLKKNDVFFLSPSDNFSYYPNHRDPWKYVWFLFNGKKASKLASLAGLTNSNPIIHLSDKQSVNCQKIFYKLIDKSLKTNKNIELYAMSMFLYLIDNLTTSHISNESFAIEQQNKYDIIVNLLRLNYNKCNFSISSLLSSIHISHAAACKLFKKFSQKTIHDYLIQIRMETAAALLKTSDFPIKNIAVRVGYMDQLVFSKQFKKYFGCSPKNYRKTDNRIISDT